MAHQNGNCSNEDMFLVVPLRLTTRQDLVAPLAQWLNSDTSPNELTSADCHDDLMRLESLRNSLVESVGSTSTESHEKALQDGALEDAREYHASLLSFEEHGFPSSDIEVERYGSDFQMELKWSCALDPESTETHANMRWERACILWNVAALESYHAKYHPTEDKNGWTQAMRHLQSAASTMIYLRQQVVSPHSNEATRDRYGSLDFSEPVLQLMENVFLAQGQMCCYQMALHGSAGSGGGGSKPKHSMLAKLAIAASDLYKGCLALVTKDNVITRSLPDFASKWGDHLKSMSMYCKMLGEHHECLSSQDKKLWGAELGRLEELNIICREAVSFSGSVQSSVSPSMEQIHDTVRARLRQAKSDNNNIHHEELFSSDATLGSPMLRPIRGQNLMTKIPPIHPALETPQRALFRRVMNPQVKASATDFMEQTMGQLDELQQRMKSETEAARKELARVNLPHSLTAHTGVSNNISGKNRPTGIPEELWKRVELLQSKGGLHQVTVQLWQLKDTAQSCRNSLEDIQKQLEEDLEMDRLFRSSPQGSSFDGHSAEQVQKTVRRNVDSFRELLDNAQRGDTHLFKILDELESDPKYKLLTFQRSQLEQLVERQSQGSGAGGSSSEGQSRPEAAELSRLLVDLSNNFKEREKLLQRLRSDVKCYDIRSQLATCTSPEEYPAAVRDAVMSFESRIMSIESFIGEQTPLMNRIMEANRIFVVHTSKRDRLSNQSGPDLSNCAVLLEESLDTVERVQKHWRDGREFYDKVTPKLEQLQQQVGDISVRLTVQRCEHEDRTRTNQGRHQQVIDDGLMAAGMRGQAGGGSGNPSENPGVVSVSHFASPTIRVDDEKVASLVSMDFDPEKVVAALEKYDNNLEQALNELLTS